MPTYDYECSSCGHKYEIFEKIGANPRKKCPKCGKRRAKRLLGMGAGVVFKGSGFYTTDYARKDPKGGEKEPKTDKKDSDGKKTARKKKTTRKKKTQRVEKK